MTPPPATDDAEIRAAARRCIRRIIWRALLEERRVLTALYLLVTFRRAVELAVRGQTAPPPKKRPSPFLYVMR